jgi:ATP-binding cassette subfamily B protein
MSKTLDLVALSWDTAHLGEAIQVLTRRARLVPIPAQAAILSADFDLSDSASVAQWVNLVATQLGIEIEPVEFVYADADRFARGMAPAILALPQDAASAEQRWLVVVKSNSWRVSLIAPNQFVHHIAPQVLSIWLRMPLQIRHRDTIDELLARAGVTVEQRERVGTAILAEHLSNAPLGKGWLLRLSPAANLWHQVLHTRLIQPLLALVGGDLIRQILLLVTWWVIGNGIFQNSLDAGWQWAWALLLLTGIPFQLLVTRAQGQFTTKLSGIFKARLLAGVLKLQPEEIRHQGLGQFLGRVLEADAVELLAIGGGLTAFVSFIELGIACGVLAIGIGGWLQVLSLVVWVLLTILLGWQYWRASRAWVVTYRAMTNDLVERMIGHRTRLAQQDPGMWHADEDGELDRYVHLSERVDHAGMWLAAIPRSWMVVGIAGVAVGVVSQTMSVVLLAISLGGVLLALQALTSIVAGIQNLVAFIQGWDQVGPLFNAASRREEPASVLLPAQSENANESARQVLLTAREISFRYRALGHYILDRCNLEILQGDRLLIEGPSGGGKSTLAAVLAGLRTPESGLLLLWGYDRSSLGGETWRQRIAAAPQFHENHVFTGTFAFNLLMGRRWPPTAQDLKDAGEICSELGLDDLIRRMPAGLQQMVGESGWQLSHGERSRMYIARALLQKSDLIILDESFAALDPETCAQSLRCVLKRAPTLLVIAHP